jgi:hypothetical protein
MRILVSIELNDEQVKKVGWALGNYGDQPTPKEEVKDWLDATLSDTINELPHPPE